MEKSVPKLFKLSLTSFATLFLFALGLAFFLWQNPGKNAAVAVAGMV